MLVPVTQVLLDAINPATSQLSAVIDVSSFARVTSTVKLSLSSTPCAGSLLIEGSNDPFGGWATILTTAVTAALNTFGFTSAVGSISHKYIRANWRSTNSPLFRITCAADVDGSLAGKYFLCGGAMSSTFPLGSMPTGAAYAVWYCVSGVGASPGIVTGSDGFKYMPLRVDIATNDSAVAVASKTQAVLAVASQGTMSRSVDGGLTWKPVAALTSMVAATPMCYGGGKFVAVTNGRAWQSVDGVSWTMNTAGTPNVNVLGVVYGAGLYVAVASVNASNSNVWTSADGITWSALANSGTSLFLYSVMWNGSLFVATTSGASIIATSPDGLVWTERNIGSGTTIAGVCWDGTYFATFGARAGDTVYRSTTGTGGWAAAATGLTTTNAKLAASTNGVIVLWNTSAARAAVSVDHGATFSTVVLPFTPVNGIVAWSPVDGVFVAAGPTGQIATSPDGFAWTLSFNFLNVAVSTTACGGGAIIVESGSAGAAEITATIPGDGSLTVGPATGSLGAAACRDGNTGFAFRQAYPAPGLTLTVAVNLT